MAKSRKAKRLKLVQKFTHKAERAQIHMYLAMDDLREMQEIQEKITALDSKPRCKRKRLPKCQPSGKRVQAAIRLSDAAPVAAMPLGFH